MNLVLTKFRKKIFVMFPPKKDSEGRVAQAAHEERVYGGEKGHLFNTLQEGKHKKEKRLW